MYGATTTNGWAAPANVTNTNNYKINLQTTFRRNTYENL
jgi:hypothetical protein